MKATFLGIKRIHGTKKADNSAYDFTRITTIAPVEDISRGKFNSSGYGMDAVEHACDPTCMALFADIKPLTEVDLIFEPDPIRQNSFRVVGINT